jgi:predicted dehydrogenase/nucleoside-diphosphate-sugar epimerase
MPEPLRIAIVGCGAVAAAHAGAFEQSPALRLTAVHDVDRARAETFRAARAPGAQVAGELAAVAELADAAVVAVPNALHVPITRQLLELGLHVLCEKPLALTEADAAELVDVAARADRVLSCGLVRRFFPSTALAADALRRGVVGAPVSVDVRESVWNWPFQAATFDPALSGGGVLVDLGPHVLDLLDLLVGEVTVEDYRDDAAGGVESMARLSITCRAGGATIPGEVRLARGTQLPDGMRIQCERGYVLVDPHDHERITVVAGDDDDGLVLGADAPGIDPFLAQAERFAAQVAAKQPGAELAAAVRAAGIVERCYRSRSVGASQQRGPIEGSAQVLVTGVTGAVGSRLVERWAADGRLSELRGVVRGFDHAARLMRFPQTPVVADVTDTDAITAAAAGCRAIVHLAIGDDPAAETASVLEAARRNGIRRVVHLSSAAVYGRGLPASIEAAQEATPVRRTGERYADVKAAAERLVLEAGEVDAFVLRPHMVYGPGLRWSDELMILLREGRVAVVEDGGWCNLIHVDDLVDAIQAALDAPASAAGHAWFVTDGKPIRWSEYIDTHARLAGVVPDRIRREDAERPSSAGALLRAGARALTTAATGDDLKTAVLDTSAGRRAYETLQKGTLGRRVLERVRSRRGHGGASPGYDTVWTEMQLSEARLRVTAIERDLGYGARISFDDGFERTAAWFRESGILAPPLPRS